MGKNRVSISVLGFLLIVSMITGCATNNDGKQTKESLVQPIQPSPIEISYKNKEKSIGFQVRESLKKRKDIYDVAVIEGDKKLIVAYKVKHLKRFGMKKIEDNIRKNLNETYPEHEFIVSSDFKIFLEAIRLKEDLDKDNMSIDDAEKRFDKIIKLQKEMT